MGKPRIVNLLADDVNGRAEGKIRDLPCGRYAWNAGLGGPRPKPGTMGKLYYINALATSCGAGP
jgi:hypothetical protein